MGDHSAARFWMDRDLAAASHHEDVCSHCGFASDVHAAHCPEFQEAMAAARQDAAGPRWIDRNPAATQAAEEALRRLLESFRR